MKDTGLKIALLVICVLFVAVFLLSPIYIAAHGAHEHETECARNACATCVQVTSAFKVLKTISVIIISAVLAFGCFSVICFFAETFQLPTEEYTLVHLKVRIDS